MSHTIGQVEEHNQQPNSGEKSTSSLTDSDYEFLFNQLLEGVAHGWHQQRIAKFFNQLGERGQQHLWVDWLGRFGVKIAHISDASGQQLGALMVRLGELTKSTPEVQEIGAMSYQLGRKLLIGDRQDLIWEYDGADLPAKTQSINDNGEISHHHDNSVSEHPPQKLTNLKTLNADPTASKSSPLLEINLSENSELVNASTPKMETVVESESDSNLEESNSAPVENLASDPSTEPEISDNPTPETKLPEQSENNIPSLDSTAAATQISSDSEADSNEADRKVGSVNWQKFISLIEKDEELVKQIAQKLDQLDINSQSLAQATLSKLNEIESDIPDKSILELVQSWFNLGLKQVSAGEFENAVASWEKALRLNPNLSEAWHNRGSALGRLSRYEDAIESFDKAL